MRTGNVVAIVLLASVLNLFAGVETVVIANVQVSKDLSGIVLDPAGEPIPGAAVIEITQDRQTNLRSTTADSEGKWSLTPIATRKIYYLRFVKPNFNTVEVRLKLDTKKGKSFAVTLPLST